VILIIVLVADFPFEQFAMLLQETKYTVFFYPEKSRLKFGFESFGPFSFVLTFINKYFFTIFHSQLILLQLSISSVNWNLYQQWFARFLQFFLFLFPFPFPSIQLFSFLKSFSKINNTLTLLVTFLLFNII